MLELLNWVTSIGMTATGVDFSWQLIDDAFCMQGETWGEKLGVGSWRERKGLRREDDLWETPTFSLTHFLARALAS